MVPWCRVTQWWSYFCLSLGGCSCRGLPVAIEMCVGRFGSEGGGFYVICVQPVHFVPLVFSAILVIRGSGILGNYEIMDIGNLCCKLVVSVENSQKKR